MDDHGERQQPDRQDGQLDAASPAPRLTIDEYGIRQQHPPGRPDGLPWHQDVRPAPACRDFPSAFSLSLRAFSRARRFPAQGSQFVRLGAG